MAKSSMISNGTLRAHTSEQPVAKHNVTCQRLGTMLTCGRHLVEVAPATLLLRPYHAPLGDWYATWAAAGREWQI